MPPKRSNIGRKTRAAKNKQHQLANQSLEEREERLIQVRNVAAQGRRRNSVISRRSTNSNCIGLASFDEISESDVHEYYCGEMSFICSSCGSHNFKDERTG